MKKKLHLYVQGGLNFLLASLDCRMGRSNGFCKLLLDAKFDLGLTWFNYPYLTLICSAMESSIKLFDNIPAIFAKV